MEGITSFADTGEELAEAISDAVGLGSFDRRILSSLGYSTGLVAGLVRGKGTKAPRGPHSKTTKEARGAPSVETRSASKKRTATSEPTQIEASVTPNAKASRTKDKVSPSGGEKIHKNSKEYAGETHVYKIRDKETKKVYKVGESAQGVRKKDGASIRAEQQVRQLYRETGRQHESVVVKKFSSKKDARKHETTIIEKGRSIHGEDTFPGNKTNR